MSVSIRIARPGDGAAIAALWLDAGSYYAELDPEHFQIPDIDGLAERIDGSPGHNHLLVAEADGDLVGWLSARLERPAEEAASQFVREHGWTRVVVDALVVARSHWRGGTGTRLLVAAESWGREHSAEVIRLDTYARSPVSVPFYEEHMGYARRSIVFQKRL